MMTESAHDSSLGRMHKRPRHDGPASEDGFEQWNGTGPPHGTLPAFASSNNAPLYGTQSDYNIHSASHLPLNEASQWQPHPASLAYPDLANYQQQPYFYQQANSNLYNTNPWPVNEQHQHPYEQTNPATYPSQDQTESTNMPYFPSNPSSNAPAVTNTIDEAVSSHYQNMEQVSHFGSSSPSALVSSAHPEASKEPSSFYFDDASMHLKIQSLSILDNLATELIHTISKASFAQVQDLMRGTENEENQAYKTLKNLFNQTRKVYSRETPFIDAIAIQMFQPNQQEIIRKANIATFISSILGAHDVSFFHLNEFFMETFVPLGHRLLKWQGAIYLELKTQTYISALMNSDGNPEAMLDELFPADLDAQILTRHPDAPSLSPSEQDFIDRSRARRSYLLAEPSNEEALRELPRKYQWTDFVREFASCISKNVEGIMNVPTRSQAMAGGGGPKTASATAISQEPATFANGAGLQAGIIPGVNIPLPPTKSSTSTSGDKDGSGAANPASQSAPKPAPTASAIRQPWTKPEEDALLSGLERVNGPHWSQILALYGRGGSVSEVLKDRNQVQLKDKARNLKLWYLKTGKEVPVALRGVTGELRKRGGARARAALGLLDDEEDAPGEGDGEAKAGGSNKKKKKAKS